MTVFFVVATEREPRVSLFKIDHRLEIQVSSVHIVKVKIRLVYEVISNA